MAIPVIMPRQGQSVESCIITKWFKQKGDQIKVGDLLFAYETDKATFEFESTEEGILLEVFFNEGDEVPVLKDVAMIGKVGEHFSKTETIDNQIITDLTKPIEKKIVIKTEEIKTVTVENNGKVKISPRAKRLAHKLGLNYSELQGSGPYGRILEKDIQSISLIKQKPTEYQKVMTLKEEIKTTIFDEAQLESKTSTSITYGDDFETRKLSNIRKIIAKTMLASLQNSAQLTHHMGADARKIMALRKKVKTAMEKGSKVNITLNDMICYAVIKALKKHPDANSHFFDDNIRIFNKVHLGFAVDTDRGLMVPTIKNADDLSLPGLASQLKQLAEACKKGSVQPELLASSSASFTVSNLGNYGVEMFTPVVNLPQVGILGVCAITNRPVDLGDGAFGFVPYIGLSLTYDHRAIDGGPATLFLKEIKEQIENFNVIIDY